MCVCLCVCVCIPDCLSAGLVCESLFVPWWDDAVRMRTHERFFSDWLLGLPLFVFAVCMFFM